MQQSQLKQRFALGQIVITTTASKRLNADDACACLRRHASGDWGEIVPADAQKNEVSLIEGLRLLSAYQDRNGTHFWIITEADRSLTTLMLEEY